MDESSKKLITGTCLGVLALGLFFLPAWAFTVICLILLMRILLWEWPRLFKLQDPFFWILMPFYPILPTCMMIYMQLYGYSMINIVLTTMVTIHDTGAYFIGKRIGKHLINPTISPKKSWEGFIGGTVFSFLSSLLFFGHHPLPLIIGTILPFAIGINFAALAGDLFESLLKRRAGLKDAGTMLPGHGGVLDRIDGLLFAVAVVFFVRNWVILLLK